MNPVSLFLAVDVISVLLAVFGLCVLFAIGLHFFMHSGEKHDNDVHDEDFDDE